MTKICRWFFSQEFKHVAASLVLDQGYVMAEPGRTLGVAPSRIIVLGQFT